MFANLSPLDHRYYLANRELFEDLARYLSEEAAIRYTVKVEIALLETLAEKTGGKSLDPEVTALLDRLPEEISPEEIYAEEEKTRHNVRAVVNVLKRHVPNSLGPLVHLGATSADILDTSQSLRLRDAVRAVLIPLLTEVEKELIRLTEDEADTPQIGRTHGQHAVPITFGYAMAEYVARLGKSIETLAESSGDLRGKLAGAVGAYNATSLMVDDPEGLEKEFLTRLGIKASEHSTQLVEPEHLLRMLLEVNVAFGILANLADDLRNLQRSEIGEVREAFGSSQVGSSTMPQKRNPWNSEHVKSLWKAFVPRILTQFMDQISEHQRDLTNSASQRFITDYLGGFAAAANRMFAILRSLYVDRERMLENLVSAGEMAMSEAMYILLALSGETDAHEIVRKLTLEAEKKGKPLVDVLRNNSEVWKILTEAMKGRADPEVFFQDPKLYTGIAGRKARRLAREYRKRMEKVISRL